MPVSEQTYKQIVLEEPERHWELVCGQLREKPLMAMAHNRSLDRLDTQVKRQLSDDFEVRESRGRLRISTGSYYEPDLFVVPVSMVQEFEDDPGEFEVFEGPVPLVVEIWSPSTGGYDASTKLPEYRLRGDKEIWYLHPYKRTLTAWRLQADGSYTETLYSGGLVRPAFLPSVAIDLDRLFA